MKKFLTNGKYFMEVGGSKIFLELLGIPGLDF